jgi:transposase
MSESKRRPGRYPDEVRERAVRMVFEHQGEYLSQWKAIESIAKKLNVNHETLRLWVRRAETGAGQRPGLTTDERTRMRELEREVKELRRANEILKAGGCCTNDRDGGSPWVPGCEASLETWSRGVSSFRPG